MKVAKIFWKYASLKKGTGFICNKSVMLGVDRRIWLDPCGPLAKANFLLVEFPMAFNVPVPIVDAIFEPPNNSKHVLEKAGRESKILLQPGRHHWRFPAARPSFDRCTGHPLTEPERAPGSHLA